VLRRAAGADDADRAGRSRQARQLEEWAGRYRERHGWCASSTPQWSPSPCSSGGRGRTEAPTLPVLGSASPSRRPLPGLGEPEFWASLPPPQAEDEALIHPRISHFRASKNGLVEPRARHDSNVRPLPALSFRAHASCTCRPANPGIIAPWRGPSQLSLWIIPAEACACWRIWTGGTLGAPAEKFALQTGGFRVDIGSVERLCPDVAGQSHRSNSMVRKGSTVRVR